MNMKKIAPLALSAILLGTVSVSAQQNNETTVAEDMQQQAAFIQVTGKISSVETSGTSKLYYYDSEENAFHFSIMESTLVFDRKGNPVELKQGDTVTLFIQADQPMIMIYPPRYSPAVVVVGEESDSNVVKVAQFDKNFISEDNNLKLNISDDTLIVNAKGEKVKKDEVTTQNAIVFYGPTTKSIPAQTTPSKIIVFPKIDDSIEEQKPEAPERPETIDPSKLNALFGNDFHEVQGKKMVPLRIVAEGLGFHVQGTNNGAILVKGAVSYTITRGEKAYNYNKTLRQFNVAPTLLEYGKTYVEYDFALELIK